MRTAGTFFFVLAFALLARGAAAAPGDCEPAETEQKDASRALEECLAMSSGECDDETARETAAKEAVARCADPEPPDTGPTREPTPAPFSGKLAFIAEGVTGDELDEATAAARLGLKGVTFVDPGTVRAARAFLGSAALDDATAARLRAEVGADRLLILDIKSKGASRFLALRVIDAGGSTRRFAEATSETFANEVKRLVAEQPPLAAAATPTPSPVPEATPTVVAVMVPPPGPTPTPTPEWDRDPDERSEFVPYVDINAFGGNKSLSEADFAPLAAHGEVGILSTIGGASWPLHLAADGYYSFASGEAAGIAVRTTTTEACFGLRRIFDLSIIRPHIGVGAMSTTVSTTAEFDDGTEIAAGTGIGFWVGGGAVLRIGRFANLGVLLRYSSAKMAMNDETVDAGGLHAGATIGFGFGGAASR